MTNHIASIRSKLSTVEIEYLKQTYGLDLGNPEVLFALSELERTRAQLQVLEARMLQKRQCHFCYGSVHAVGPLAKAPQGALICHDCAVACIAAIAAQASDDQ